MQKNSLKRRAIYNCLASAKTHPDAEWIYEQLKPEYPEMGIATVYRNLKRLEEEGLIRSMGVFGGKERYDACVNPHIHAICGKCGRFIDVNISMPEALLSKVEAMTGFDVVSSNIVFSGVCGDCKVNSNN